jgi:hypothetical protein
LKGISNDRARGPIAAGHSLQFELTSLYNLRSRIRCLDMPKTNPR